MNIFLTRRNRFDRGDQDGEKLKDDSEGSSESSEEDDLENDLKILGRGSDELIVLKSALKRKMMRDRPQ